MDIACASLNKYIAKLHKYSVVEWVVHTWNFV